MLKFIIKLLLLISVCSFFFLQYYFKQEYVTELRYNQQSIIISRDQHSIPRIKSKTYLASMYALGYTMAQDRLFQINLKKMIANGRLSQILGIRTISVDRLFRQLNFKHWVKQIISNMQKQNPYAIKIYQAFVDGINNFVQNNHLPLEFYLLWLEFERFTIEDSILIGKLLEWAQAADYSREYVRSKLLSNYSKQEVDKMLSHKDENFILPEYILSDIELETLGIYQKFNFKQSQRFQFLPEKINQILDLGIVDYLLNSKDGKGSNSWVISGNLTASGKAILANDPHLDNAIPTQWYQVELTYFTKKGVQINAQLAYTPGTIFGLGKSNYISFGCTNSYIDNQDLYKEEIRGDQYFYEQQWIKLKSRQQIIKVRGKEDQKLIVRETHRGPLISRILFYDKMLEVNENLSLVWGGFNSQHTLFSRFIETIEVSNLDEARSLLLSINSAPTLNIVFITRDNDIGFFSVGIYPIRRNPQSGAYIKDGRTNEHDWIGFMSTQEKPNIINPEKGYIVTANNKLASQNYKGGFFRSGGPMTGRGTRINQIIRNQIAKGHKFTIEDSISIQLDTTDCYCVEILPKLIQVFPKISSYLKGWDCNLTSSSSQASLYSLFFYKFEKRLNPVGYQLQGSYQFNHYVYKIILNMKTNDNKIRLMEQALQETLNYLKNYFSSQNFNDWKWGKLHQDHLSHIPLGRTPLSLIFDLYAQGRGNQNTPYAAAMRQISKDNYNIYHKANLRFIVSFQEGKSIWITDSGQSSNIFSKHYSDQFKLISADKYLSMELIPKDTVISENQL